MVSEVRTVPAVALRGAIVFPKVEAILTFGRNKSKSAVNASFAGDHLMVVFTQKDARVSDPSQDDLFDVGTLGIIQQLMPTDNEVHILFRGVVRVQMKEVVSQDPFLICKVSEIPEDIQRGEAKEALSRHLIQIFEKAIRLGKAVDVQTVMRLLSTPVDAAELADQIAYLLDLKTSQKQDLLQELSIENRLRKVINYLSHEISILELEKTISAKTQKRFEEQMRKAMLREREKVIKQELETLGETSGDDEMEELRRKVKQANMPVEVRKKVEKELQRIAQMPSHNPEYGYLRNWLDTVIEMPWDVASSTDVSIKHAVKILDGDHYALQKAKERIIEFLAVMQLKNELTKKSKLVDENQTRDHPTILCFIGPPGVGKTSIGRSVAKALGRKFVRVSLGGIRDEAEIRGHRRTYVGALPGRIIQGIKNAGTKNPVFMLDEIDKLGADFRGDPSSALLEALDPEQNKEFSDHYLEVPFDLSHVMFICTGNVLDTIPAALRDRMEIIRFPGYTEEDKYHIAQKYLWSKQLLNHGLAKNVDINPEALREVISRYTREAGVRNLERNLAMICRKLARRIAEGSKSPKQVGKEDIRTFLGPQQFSSLLAEAVDDIGISTGLAVTAVGGEIILVETALMPGKGKLTLTGQLGDVMKESATAAFSYARSHWRDLGLKEDFAKNLDVHIHVPEGAVPKDGPSAGVAMTTSLVSALTNTKTHREVGMTGEITLRGRVLEIGGVKEKVIAAHRAGLKIVVLPKSNQKDMEEVPEKVKQDIKFIFAEHVDEVLEVAFKRTPRQAEMDNQVLQPYIAS